MKKLLNIILILLSAATFAACGCNGNIVYFKDDYVQKYNDVFYDSAADWISEDFQSENTVRVSGFIYDDIETCLSSTKTFIVTDREQFNNIFVENIEELEVNFDSQMIIVYTFAAQYVLPAFILDMNINGETLTVDYTIPLYPNAGSATQPFQRWFVLILDKSEITSVGFNEKTTYYRNK
ncbi:MAG: hypothetical protein ACI4QI_02320 [Candidatus Coproplasma sp.]